MEPGGYQFKFLLPAEAMAVLPVKTVLFLYQKTVYPVSCAEICLRNRFNFGDRTMR